MTENIYFHAISIAESRPKYQLLLLTLHGSANSYRRVGKFLSDVINV